MNNRTTVTATLTVGVLAVPQPTLFASTAPTFATPNSLYRPVALAAYGWSTAGGFFDTAIAIVISDGTTEVEGLDP